MLLKHLLKYSLLLSVFCGSTLLAQTQVSLLYTSANPDWKPFETGHGFAIAGEYDFDNGLFVQGFYNNADFMGSGPEVGGENFTSWLEAGIGYAFKNQWGQFYTLITYESVKSELTTFDGAGAHFGYRNDFADNWAAILQFGVINTDFQDYQIEAKLIYDISDNFAITLGLRDYADWDLTSYEAGISYYFK